VFGDAVHGVAPSVCRRRRSACLGCGTVLAGSAAAGPCRTAGVFSVPGATGACTNTSERSEGTFAVPADVSSLSVTAVGAPGGDAFESQPGGLGARVLSTTLPVPSGTSRLCVDVAQPGNPGIATSCGAPTGTAV
jgi:hypothetical protein